ncbi:MAG TPA: GtrA family protein [Actinophytocola sp.]|uniref:GtrA family protein n=1 Tax=Actinophytocola sp. TaxID=1872138 RepID=UPI002DDD5F29|nr:GtrA family protein [Actinophytocola sp.]HEV2782351.1 GtrA family protein [Actinophytocola sp.]
MPLIETALARVPEPLRARLIKHRELLKFAVVGGICFVVTNLVNYALKLTILNTKPVTALAIAVVIATIVSYILNREWSFRTRGGRERHHEAALFFLISGIGVGLNSLPLYVSRYLLHLQVPRVSLLVQEIADFGMGMILGTVLAMVFRLWAFKKWVFPQADARPRVVRGWGRPRRATGGADERAA